MEDIYTEQTEQGDSAIYEERVTEGMAGAKRWSGNGDKHIY